MALKVLVFAGTTEGRELCDYLASRGADVTASVATEYGRVVLPEREGLRVRAGRLDAEGIRELAGGFPLVVDATHPYAEAVTRNIREACARAGVEYVRLLRPPLGGGGAACGVTVPDARAAAEYLRSTQGGVLLTTGSKELPAFAGLPNCGERCYARVLPTAEAIGSCRAAGLSGRHIVCMQGPFSHEMNLALLHETGAKYLVTKDSGAAGGFAEKLSAARAAGAAVVLIGRPQQEEGLDYRRAAEYLEKRLGLGPPPNRYFPVFLEIAGRTVVFVGGGKIASRRAAALLRFGARVVVAAPALAPELARLCEEGRAEWKRRPYEDGDLEGAALAVCASDSRGVNAAAAREAKMRGIPVSVADSRGDSTFFFPALVEGGGVLGGFISAGGGDHGAVREKAERVRKFLSGL